MIAIPARRSRQRHPSSFDGRTWFAPAFAAPLALAAAALAVALAVPGEAHANGAFPDSQSVLTPGDPPREIVLVTNFGILLSEDAGGSWLWSCEQAESSYGTLYITVGTADMTPGLARSADGGAHWSTSLLGGDLGPGTLRIVGVDPVEPGRVFLRWKGAAGGEAIALTTDGGASAAKVLELD